jgi:hypothetical protein
MRSTALWRLEPASDGPAETEPLADDLRVYLAHAALTSILVRIGSRERAYLALESCAGCIAGRCVPGCRTDLVRRALHARGGASLIPAEAGLATRPYTRLAYAWPQSGAKPLRADLLAGWSELRLVVRWSRTAGRRLRCAALLHIDGEGPSPQQVLRRLGWAALPILPPLQRWFAQPLPVGLLWSTPWSHEAFLLTPTTTSQPTPAETDPLAGIAVDGLLAEWLAGAIDAPTALLQEEAALQQHAAEAASRDWPAGPGSLTAAVLAELVPQLIAEPSFHSARAGQSGITKGRLVSLKHPALTETTARSLMVWLDWAGVLAPPEGGQGAWRAPRRFATEDLATIAAQLKATPLPRDEEIRRAYGGA